MHLFQRVTKHNLERANKLKLSLGKMNIVSEKETQKKQFSFLSAAAPVGNYITHMRALKHVSGA